MKKNHSRQDGKNPGDLILGIWQLKSRVDTDSSGQRHIDPVLGPDPLGILCFSTCRFAAQFMKRDRSSTPSPRVPISGANNSSAVDGYDAYFGTYDLDESTGSLKVRLEGAISPTNIGSEFTRAVSVTENELVISLPTTSPDGLALTRTLTFVRLN